jgi:uncharacterized repeat protein (TIGR02543 family)
MNSAIGLLVAASMVTTPMAVGLPIEAGSSAGTQTSMSRSVSTQTATAPPAYISFNTYGGKMFRGQNDYWSENDVLKEFKMPDGPAKADNVFVAWKSVKDGSVHHPGDIIKHDDLQRLRNSSGIPFEAVYESAPGAKVVKVTFDKNSDTASGEGSTYTVIRPGHLSGDSVQIPRMNIVNRSGKSLTGWNTKPDGTGTSYGKFSKINPAGDTTLYAQWGAGDTKTMLKFDNNGHGDHALSDAIGDPSYGTFVGASPSAVTGYEFIGWNTKPDGTGNWYLTNSWYLVQDPATLYAQWKNVGVTPPATNTVTITYDHMDGTNPTTQTGEGKVVVRGGSPTRDGYEFTGWNTGKDGTGKVVRDGDTLTENTTLYAQWKTNKTDDSTKPSDPNGSNKVTVIYDEMNGGAFEQTGDGRVVVRDSIPSRDGYRFMGWNTKSDGTGKTVRAGDVLTEDSRLYAQWEKVGTSDNAGHDPAASSKGQAPVAKGGDPSRTETRDPDHLAKTGAGVSGILGMFVVSLCLGTAMFAVKRRKA